MRIRTRKKDVAILWMTTQQWAWGVQRPDSIEVGIVMRLLGKPRTHAFILKPMQVYMGVGVEKVRAKL